MINREVEAWGVDMEPLPLEAAEAESPSAVVDGAIAEWGRKRTPTKAARGRPTQRRRTKEVPDEPEEEEEEPEEEDDGGEDGGDDDGDDGGDEDPEEDEEEEEVEGAVIVGEVRTEDLPGASARGDPVFWYVQYRRPDRKGSDGWYWLGSYRFPTLAKASTWAKMYAEQVGPAFLLGSWVEAFSDFARVREGCFVVPRVPGGQTREERPGCPVPSYATISYEKVGFRTPSAADLGVRTAAEIPKSVWKVTVDRRTITEEWFTAFSVWTVEGSPMRQLIEQWNARYPNATVEKVEAILAQVRVPVATAVVTTEQLREMAQAINYEQAAQVAREVMPSL